MSPFLRLSHPTLLMLSEALAWGKLVLPCTRMMLDGLVPETLIEPITLELNRLDHAGMPAKHIAYTLNLLATERQQRLEHAPINLAWTGPELPGAASRDTAILVHDLFRTAQSSVLISSFAIDWGQKCRELFQPLADQMASHPDLVVRLFLNIHRPHKDTTSSSVLIHRFSQQFRQSWPGDRLPTVFYDPRALEISASTKACLHAKCVVVDHLKTLITSANFTEAAHHRNIEAGVLIENPGLAKSLIAQFETLVAFNILLPLQ